MLRIPGYRLGRLLLDDELYTVYRGWCEADDRPVLIKAARAGRGGELAQARLRLEYRVCQGCRISGIVPAFALVRSGEGQTLVLEGVPGDFLRNLMRDGPLGIEGALRLTASVVQVLAALHRSNIVHRGIRPEHVIVASGGARVWLTGLGMACGTASGAAADTDEAADDTCVSAYLAPEQTGRVEHPLDYRADYYGLSAVLYELLIGRPPFEAEDSAELIHAHIARAPIPPADRSAGVPRVISDLVLKLLAKAPEDRYQSAQGLLADLDECLSQWRARGVAPFASAGRMFPSGWRSRSGFTAGSAKAPSC
jgi:serine/threonine protein kinase